MLKSPNHSANVRLVSAPPQALQGRTPPNLTSLVSEILRRSSIIIDTQEGPCVPPRHFSLSPDPPPSHPSFFFLFLFLPSPLFFFLFSEEVYVPEGGRYSLPSETECVPPSQCECLYSMIVCARMILCTCVCVCVRQSTHFPTQKRRGREAGISK